MKRKLLIFGIVLVLGAIGIVYGITANQSENDEALKADWIETIESAILATSYGPQSVKENGGEFVDDVEEAEKLLAEYNNSLSAIFTADEAERTADIYKGYTEDVATLAERIEDTEQIVSEFIDFGFFETEIVDYDYSEDGDTAVVYAVNTLWAKSIDRVADCEFEAVFSVNKTIERFDMVLEDGIWKVSNAKLVSAYLMEGDYELEQTFSTYQEAAAYAVTVTPTNVLANEKLVINED